MMQDKANKLNTNCDLIFLVSQLILGFMKSKSQSCLIYVLSMVKRKVNGITLDQIENKRGELTQDPSSNQAELTHFLNSKRKLVYTTCHC